MSTATQVTPSRSREATRHVDAAVSKLSPCWFSKFAQMDRECQASGLKGNVTPPTSPRALLDATLELAMLGEAHRLQFEGAAGGDSASVAGWASGGDDAIVAAIRRRQFEVAVDVMSAAEPQSVATVRRTMVRCCDNDSGMLVKMRLARTHGAAVIDRRLESAGSAIEDDARLVDLGIGEGACLQLLLDAEPALEPRVL